MIVRVNSLDNVLKAGTLWVFDGAAEDGRSVSFAVDARMGRELLGAIADNDEIECSVESWQLL